MMNVARRFLVALVALAAVPAYAEDGPITHTDQLVVVTPNPPVVIQNGGAAPGVAPAPMPAPAPVVATTTAPQNEDWNEVSHINGTLVKVGEKQDYMLRYRKTNIATNPLGWMMGYYGVSVSHAVHPNVAVRLDANIMNNSDWTGTELGASLPIYFRRVYSGPFIEPGIITRTMTSEYCDDYYASGGGCSMSHTMAGPEMLFGWHWSFDSGLNVAAAFGIARDLNEETSEYDYDDMDIEPAGYFRVGYAF